MACLIIDTLCLEDSVHAGNRKSRKEFPGVTETDCISSNNISRVCICFALQGFWLRLHPTQTLADLQCLSQNKKLVHSTRYYRQETKTVGQLDVGRADFAE